MEFVHYKNKKKNEKNASLLTGSVEQLKYGNFSPQRSTKTMIGSPSIRPLIPHESQLNQFLKALNQFLKVLNLLNTVKH